MNWPKKYPLYPFRTIIGFTGSKDLEQSSYRMACMKLLKGPTQSKLGQVVSKGFDFSSHVKSTL